MPSFFRLIGSILGVVLRGVVCYDSRKASTRSAIFLICFTVVHAVGNLTIFWGGKAAFNEYGHKLNCTPSCDMPALLLLEAYMALGFVAHAATGLALAWQKRKIIMQEGVWGKGGAMLVSGLVLTAFLVLHLKTFKFGAGWVAPTLGRGGAAAAARDTPRDLAAVVTATFSQPRWVAWYVGCCGMLGVHLCSGWTAAHAKAELGVAKAERPIAKLVGHVLTLAVTAGFMSLPLYVYAGFAFKD